MICVNFAVILFSIFKICSARTFEPKVEMNYNQSRLNMIEDEERRMLGGLLILNEKEEKVNELLMKVKNIEMNRGLTDLRNFAPGMHFFKAKPIIECSRVFKFIKKMPKGASLHGHNTAMVSSEWFLKNITYRPGLSLCKNKRGENILTFRQSSECQTELKLLSDLRREAHSAVLYDWYLEKIFNLYTPNPEIDYPDMNTVWKKFQTMFVTVSDVIRYLPVFRDYHTQILQEMFDDNIMYAELRTSFGDLYDNLGTVYTHKQTAGIMRDIIKEFKRTHSGFLGVKTIHAIGRMKKPDEIDPNIKIFSSIFKEYPDFVIGFDLVGQEDKGYPLIDFYSQLKTLPQSAKFFFHAGETNFYGSSTDMNLLDAVLMNTTRIGHGYAVIKHPVILEAVKRQNIAIEISPLSNQVLGLVHDLRNHPGAFYISENIPIVIANDDPGFWNAKGLSYDFYYALMSFAPQTGGLKILKQLVLNSINYSILTEHERVNAEVMHAEKWEIFLDDVLAGNVI